MLEFIGGLVLLCLILSCDKLLAWLLIFTTMGIGIALFVEYTVISLWILGLAAVCIGIEMAMRWYEKD